MLFEISEEGSSFPQIEYSLYQSLNELSKINKYFRQFDNLQEVYIAFKVLIKNNNLSIIKEEQLIKIKIINTITEKEFFINIPMKEKDIQSEVNSLISYTKSLTKRIENLENQIENNKKLFENKIKEIEQKHMKEINIIKKEINEIKKNQNSTIITNSNTLFKESSIIKPNEIDLILSWIDRKPKDTELLLNSQIDGDRWNTFINKVKNKSPTLVIFKTKDNFRFGGFTKAFWPEDGPAKDEHSFIFSLDKKERYKVINPECAIGCGKNSWVSFGNGFDLYFYDKCISKQSFIHKNYNYKLPSNLEINGGKSDFMILNYEVYHIKY